MGRRTYHQVVRTIALLTALMLAVPTSIMRDGGPQIAVVHAIVRTLDIVTDADAGRHTIVRQARLTSHAPPLPALPLRI